MRSSGFPIHFSTGSKKRVLHYLSKHANLRKRGDAATLNVARVESERGAIHLDNAYASPHQGLDNIGHHFVLLVGPNVSPLNPCGLVHDAVGDEGHLLRMPKQLEATIYRGLIEKNALRRVRSSADQSSRAVNLILL